MHIVSIYLKETHHFWAFPPFASQIFAKASVKVLTLTKVHEIRASRVAGNSGLND